MDKKKTILKWRHHQFNIKKKNTSYDMVIIEMNITKVGIVVRHGPSHDRNKENQ